LVFAIILMPVSVYADGANSGEEKIHAIKFEEIEPVIMERNPIIKANSNTLEGLINNRNSIEDVEEELSDTIDGLSAAINMMNDAINQIDASIKIMETLIGQQVPALPPTGAENGINGIPEAIQPADGLLPGTDYTPYATLQTLMAVKKLYEANVDTLRQNRKALRDQIVQLPNQKLELEKGILQVEMANKSIIWGAQNLYFAYGTLERQKDELERNLKLLDDQLYILEIQEDIGMVTSLDVSAVRNQREQLVLGIKTLENQIENVKGEFNLMLGQDFNTDLVIAEIPNLDESKVLEMDYEEDLETALKSSYSLKLQSYNYKIKDNSLEWAEDSGKSDEERAAELDFENAAINFEQEHKKIKLTFHKLYQNVKDKFSALEIENKNLEYQQQKYDVLNLKYDLGRVSKMEWEQGKAEYEAQMSKVETARQDLLQAWTQYNWFLRGLNFGD